MDTHALWTALALVLIIEGLTPFSSPAAWRRLMTQVMKSSDNQLRWFGLVTVLIGLVILVMVW